MHRYQVQASDGRPTVITVEGRNYSPAVDPVQLVANLYRTDGRVGLQASENGDAIWYGYDDVAKKTTVTNTNSGDVTVYVYGDVGYTTQITDARTKTVTRTRHPRSSGAAGRPYRCRVAPRPSTTPTIAAVQRATADPRGRSATASPCRIRPRGGRTSRRGTGPG